MWSVIVELNWMRQCTGGWLGGGAGGVGCHCRTELDEAMHRRWVRGRGWGCGVSL